MVFAIQFGLASIVGMALYLEHRNHRAKERKKQEESDKQDMKEPEVKL